MRRLLALALLGLQLSACSGSASIEDQRAAQEEYLRARGQTPERVAEAAARTARLDSLRTADPEAYAAEVAPADAATADAATAEDVDAINERLDRIERKAGSASTNSAILLGMNVTAIVIALLLLATSGE